MAQTDSASTRSIGLSGLVRWLIVVAGVVAVGAAFVAGSYALAIVGVVFLIVAAGLGYWVRRVR